MALFRRKRLEHSQSATIEPPKQENKVIPDGAVETKLHFAKYWDMTSKERYIYQYHHRKLPKIEEGQISITGIKFIEIDGEIAVEAFIQNGLSKAITIQAVDLVLLDEKNQLAAKNNFSLAYLGELPPHTSTPMRFLFSAEDRLSDAAVTDKWRIQFELKGPTRNEVLDLDESWKERLSAERQIQLEKIIERLPELGPSEVNITGIEIHFLNDQSLEVIALIRNGLSKELQLKQLPLVVKDAAGDVVCEGDFNLPPLQIKSRSAKPWSFRFPSSLIMKENPDLAKWVIVVKNKEQEDS